MIRLCQPVSSQALLALWDPFSNSLTNLTSNAPAVFQQGVGVLARDGTRSAVVSASNGGTQLSILDAALNQVGNYSSPNVRGLTFSRDVKYLYVSETFPAVRWFRFSMAEQRNRLAASLTH
jgi:hypothetical protein